MKITTVLHALQPQQVRKVIFKRTLHKTYVSWIGVTYIGGMMIYFSIAHGWMLSLSVLIGLVTLMPLMLAYRVTSDSMLRKYNLRLFDRTRLVEFDDSGYLIRYDSGSNRFTVWTDIDKALDRDEATTIYITPDYFDIIPHSAWPSTVERQQFLDLLRTKNLIK